MIGLVLVWMYFDFFPFICMLVLHELKRISFVSISGKWVPYDLSPGNCEDCVDLCETLFTRQLKMPFLNWHVTGAEKWILCYNVKCHCRWISWENKSAKEPRGEFHQKWIIFSVCWDIQAIIHNEPFNKKCWSLLLLNFSV